MSRLFKAIANRSVFANRKDRVIANQAKTNDAPRSMRIWHMPRIGCAVVCADYCVPAKRPRHGKPHSRSHRARGCRACSRASWYGAARRSS